VPRFAPGEAEPLERLRARYDPQATLVPAHVTLVFGRPEAERDTLIARVRAAVEAEPGPLAITLAGTRIEMEAEVFLFLLVQQGRERVERLYRALNDDARVDFTPHVTLGRFADRAAAERAAAAAESLRAEVTIETLQVEHMHHDRLDRLATLPFGRR